MAERPRIVGTEMEWPATAKLHNSKNFQQLSVSEGLHDLLSPRSLPEGLMMVGGSLTNKMLQNGARFYADVGDKVEYAAPETTSFRTAVLTEFASEAIIATALENVVESSDKIQEAILAKRVVDDKCTGWGYHINISADRVRLNEGEYGGSPEAYSKLIMAHLATSQALFGAGAVYKTASHAPLQYSFGQKILSMNRDCDSGTTQNKPFINTRDEPHADRDVYRRLHIVGVDPHISPRATWLQIGSLSLVASIAEQKPELRDLIEFVGGAYPTLNVGRRVAHDLLFRERFALKDGRQVAAHDVQAMLAEAADGLSERTSEQDAVLEAWKSDIDKLEHDPMKLDQSDAIAKLLLIRRHMERAGHTRLDEDEAVARFIDIDYSTICRIKKTDSSVVRVPTLAEKMRSRRFKEHTPHPADIKWYMYNAPTDTRATERGRLIKEGLAHQADWTRVILESGIEVDLSDPYDTSRRVNI